jgi:N-acetylmuramic acid 6-phosphate etherase
MVTPVERASSLDLLSVPELVDAIVAGQADVVSLVRDAQPQLSAAVEVLTIAYDRGGRLILMGAGTSGRLAVMEASEVPGTYGIDEERIKARVAGGGANHLVGTDAAEDDTELAAADVEQLAITNLDALVAVTASGATPYTCAAARLARQRGASVIGVTNTPNSTLAGLADVTIEVPVGSEVVSGSTRLAAGSAQKLVLNALTTATMVRLGRVHEHYMVDVVAANDKLRRRVADMVAASTGCEAAQAWTALEACAWNARAAIVHLATGLDPASAAEVAAEHRTVREAIYAAR